MAEQQFTDEQIGRMFADYITQFEKRRLHPYMMATRTTNMNKHYLSSAEAWRWKWMLEKLPTLPPEIVSGLQDKFPEWISHILQIADKKATVAQETVDAAPSVKKFFPTIWAEFKKSVEEGAERVVKSEREMIANFVETAKDAKYNLPRNQMAREDRVWLLRTAEARSLATDPDKLSKHLFELYNDFVTREHDKVQTLLYRLFSKVKPTDVRASGRSVKEVTFKYDDALGDDQVISFTRVGAGGHNIQRYHFRWVVTLWTGRKKYEFKSTDK